jgi:hypothetical protein
VEDTELSQPMTMTTTMTSPWPAFDDLPIRFASPTQLAAASPAYKSTRPPLQTLRLGVAAPLSCRLCRPRWRVPRPHPVALVRRQLEITDRAVAPGLQEGLPSPH